LADKISNLRSILTSPPTNWDSLRKREYFDWANRVVETKNIPGSGQAATQVRFTERFP
jgi:hypothetical protein